MTTASLTGIWQGLYTYTDFGEHVPFTATLLDGDGALHGTTQEDDHVVSRAGRDATLIGERSGRAVRFTKTYRGRERFEPVEYVGHLSPDSTEVEGRWTIPGGQGTFLMIRPEREPAQAAVAVEERV